METPSLVVEWAKFLCVTIIHRLLLNGGEVFLEGSILLFDVVESWAPIHKMLLILVVKSFLEGSTLRVFDVVESWAPIHKMLLIVLSLHHIISKIIGSVM